MLLLVLRNFTSEKKSARRRLYFVAQILKKQSAAKKITKIEKKIKSETLYPK